jgi:antitoxin ParD1/3/4
MNIQLTPEVEDMIQSKVESGRYESGSDVVRIALKLLDKRDQAIDDIRQQIQQGWDSTEAGHLVDGEEFMEHMLAELNEEIRLEEAEAAGQLANAK